MQKNDKRLGGYDYFQIWRFETVASLMDDTTSTLVPSQSTPIKHGTSTLLKFTTNHRYRVKEMTDMGNEMKDYVVGPMPADEFLDEFLPLNAINTSRRAQVYQQGCFKPVVSCEIETAAYEPFVGFKLLINPSQLMIWQSLYR